MDIERSLFWSKYKFYILSIGACFFAYFNSLFSPFVWDDISQIQNNYFIQTLTNIPKFFLGSTFGGANSTNLSGLYYRPLMTLLFSLIFSFWGLNTFYYHFLQVLIHAINSIFIFILFKKFLKEKLAFFLSLIFVVHPINVEAISFISALGEPLFFLFGITALLISLTKTYSLQRVFLISLLLFCSLLSKETGILFLIMIVAYRIIFRKSQLVKSLISVIIPLLLYFYLRFSIAKIFVQKIPDVPMMTASLVQRIFTMPSIFLFYLKTFIFPYPLLISQQWSNFEANTQFFISFFISLLIISGISIFILWTYHKRKYLLSPLLFFSLWFFIGIGFHLQLIPFDFTVADRWFYFPMVGILGMIGVAIETIKYPSIRTKNIGIGVIVSVIFLFSFRTIFRNTNWQSGISLYSSNLQFVKDDVIENALAVELMRVQNYTEAQVHFKNLLLRNPNEPALYINIAETYEYLGDISNAKTFYKKILDSDGSGIGYYNLSRIALQKDGNLEEAKRIAQKGIQRYPQNANIWLILAIAEYQLGNQQTALIDATKAKNLLPSPQTENIYETILNHKSL